MKNQLVSIHTFSKIYRKMCVNNVQRLRRRYMAIGWSTLLCMGVSLSNSQAYAQHHTSAEHDDTKQILQQIRWQSESKVREILGAPKAVRGPIGTHASYQLWEYEDYSVAIANNRAFHLFDKNSLHRMVLEEDRP